MPRCLALLAAAAASCCFSPRAVVATLPILDPGCRLVPVVDAPAAAAPAPPAAGGAEKAPPGTCFADPTDKRTLPEGVDGCCGALAAGKAPAKLTPPLKCDETKMTPELCAAACLDAFADKGGVAAIGVEWARECYCSPTWPVEKAGKPEPAPAVAASSNCADACAGDPLRKCGGTNFVEVWRVECGSDWGWGVLLSLLICTTLYVGGGAAYAIKAKGVAPGLEALPHREFWTEASGLVIDGARFTKARIDEARGGGGGGGGGGYSDIKEEAKLLGGTAKSGSESDVGGKAKVDPDSPLKTDDKPIFGGGDNDSDNSDDDELVE